MPTGPDFRFTRRETKGNLETGVLRANLWLGDLVGGYDVKRQGYSQVVTTLKNLASTHVEWQCVDRYLISPATIKPRLDEVTLTICFSTPAAS